MIDAHCILIQEDPVRVQHIQEMKKKYPFLNLTETSAIYWKNLTRECLEGYVSTGYLRKDYWKDIVFNQAIRAGQIGAYLSHVKTWEWLIESGQDQLLILEDDFELCPDFEQRFEQAKSELPEDYDILWLFVHGAQGHLKQQSLPGKSIQKVQAPTFGCVGYLLSKSGAQKLISSIKPMTTAIDEMIIGLVRQNGLNAYITRASLVETIGSLSMIHQRPLNSNIWKSKQLFDWDRSA